MTVATKGQEITEENKDSQASTSAPPNVNNANNEIQDDNTEPYFPKDKLLSLDEKISSLRWVVPVLPEQELEQLLKISIDLAKKNLDTKSEACQRFFREGLTISFTKILTDDAVSSWKPNIHSCIYQNCLRLVELCVIKLPHDWFPLLELLAMVLNPFNKFHIYNSTRLSETVGSRILSEEELFARPGSDPRNTRGWLVDLINKFGELGGFQKLLDRFQSGKNLNISLVYALLAPFGRCHECLTPHTIHKYIHPILEMIPEILEKITDEDLRREAKVEQKTDNVSQIIKFAKYLASKIPDQEELLKTYENFRLKMLLRQLQVSSFNGKMNALNEINKVISTVCYSSRLHGIEDEGYLTAEKMANWINDNKVLEIVLRDSLHQPQYVEKLEKILRFVIKERVLTLSDLDAVWAAQVGKHEAIVKNVHDLLAKLAWDFSTEQLDHLFQCFQNSWTSASKRQRERLLELIRRLAEDDKDGVMANKVLTLFWNLAHADDVTIEIMDQALAAHVKILDYSCSQERDAQKTIWLDKCVEELKAGGRWVLPALKLIREICSLYEQSSAGAHHQQQHTHLFYRQEVIERLQRNHSLVILVSNILTTYMDRLRALYKEQPDLTAETYMPDGRYCHNLQVQERLNFLRFLLKDGQLWLCEDQAKQIWQCLAENGVFPSDRESCFRWFSKLMGEEPDLDPGINREFFENNILQIDPMLLTESGIRCFERFFKAVNVKEGKLKYKRRTIITEDLDLVGLEYLWKVVTLCPDDIAARAIELLREVSTNLGPRLSQSQVEFHDQYIGECFDRLRAHYDTISILQKSSVNEKELVDSIQITNRIKAEAVKTCRVLKVLHEYISEYDNSFIGERKILPLHRACYGRNLTLLIRFSTMNRQPEDLEVHTHTNDTLLSLRKSILKGIKSGLHCKLELYINGELIDPNEDRKVLSQIPIRNKMLLSAKVVQSNSNMASSQDSSSDSSTSSPQHLYDDANSEAEYLLPGVLMSQNEAYAHFFCQLMALGSQLDFPLLRNSAYALLRLMPPDGTTMLKFKNLFSNCVDKMATMESMFFSASPAEVLYHLEVLYSMLMPAMDTLSDKVYDFQYSFITSGEAHVFLEMLTKNNFLTNSDCTTRRSAYLIVLKICKLVLTSVAHVLVRLSEDHSPPENEQNAANTTTPGMYLRQALRSVPGHSDHLLRQVSSNISQGLAQLMVAETVGTGQAQALFSQALNWELPDLATALALIRLVWAASSDNLGSLNSPPETLHTLSDPINQKSPIELDTDDVLLCKEALELLSTSVILNPSSLQHLYQNSWWPYFITDLVLLNPNCAIRVAAAEQLIMICTCGAASRMALELITPLLFSLLDSLVLENLNNSHEYFQLTCRLVNVCYNSGCPLSDAETLLANEVEWLKKARDQNEILIEGHLGLAKELLNFVSEEQKCELGIRAPGRLIYELIEDFVFPASKLLMQLNKTKQLGEDPAIPICETSATQAAAFDLLVSLCVNCVPNYKQLVNMLTEMFYSDPELAITEWDYLPAVGPRPFRGFVGLKNAGATCYMNSVLQQLYMVENIKEGILAAEGAANDPTEDFSGEERIELDLECTTDERNCMNDNRKDYNVGILKQVQAIFGHLACSRLQYYVPRGLWRHFKLQGEPVNLREQQDAVEFFMALVESLDEALKTLGQEQIMSKILGGSYSDQKICKGCPHRYSKEEPFSVISVDIRNHSSLPESMEQYVKGELLEGADAYHCEKCAKKVVTVKRLCVKKLPPILAIQLKRFEYDFERVCAIKFNDYFEFPRELDMEPYTVSGLAKIEGEIIDCDLDPNAIEVCTKYRLSGIVVHSGQASGGHYYSYIRHHDPSGEVRWYKFDDGDVSECRMGDDEEMKVQCFGGDYMGEVFDPMMKRTTYRRQKRWWNAYMLFYTRQDVEEQSFLKAFNHLSLTSSKHETHLKMPLAIENSIRKQNIKFLHHRSQFTVEYFAFMKKLASTCAQGTRHTQSTEQLEQLCLLSVQLVSNFLFHTGWHTKKNLRGPAMDWADVMCLHLRPTPAIRIWFGMNMLFNHMNRFCEYLLSCPSNEVRSAFIKIIVLLAHYSIKDPPCPCPPGINNKDPSANLSDHIIWALLSLLHREVSEHGRHLPNYCTVFHTYASQGIQEKAQLLKLNVPATFMLVALDEGPGPAIKYQYIDIGKLNQLVSCLIRCCDVSSKCQSSNGEVLPNPYKDNTIPNYIMPISPQAEDLLFTRSSYIKKVIEDTNLTEDAIKLLQFCSWENPHFSKVILTELLWHIAFAYCQELRHHIELLLSVLLIEDSWQTHRIHNALKGVPDEKEGLLDTIMRAKTHYQKRAYQCIKCLVALFTKSQVALNMLMSQADLHRTWVSAVTWLQDELERKYPSNTQYYNTWSSPAQSNENSNGYFLERSNSAKKILERALELIPETDIGIIDDEGVEDTESQDEVVIGSNGQQGGPSGMASTSNGGGGGSVAGVSGVGSGGGGGVQINDEQTLL